MTITLTGSDYALAPGQELDLVNQSGIIGGGPGPFAVDIGGKLVITTAGVANGLLATLYGLNVGETNVATAGALTLEASAHLSIDTTALGNAATGVADSGLSVVNAGLIEVHTAGGIATGVDMGAVETAVVPQMQNLGEIEVSSTGAAAFGLVTGIVPKVLNAGLIDVTGQFGSIGVKINVGTDLTNSGQIVTHGAGLTAVQAVGTSFLPISLINSGLIQGDEAIKVVPSVGAANISQMALQNSGSVLGQVDLGSGADTLTNTGTMIGSINLGTGNDLYDGHLGTETGLLQAGQGDDTLVGGTAFDNLQGNQGNDSEAGGAGDDFVVGGQGDDVLHGDAGVDVVWGNLGNDTLDGGDGNDQVRGGQGDDSVSGGAGDDFVSGDRGNDTESGGAGADNFHGSQDAGVDRVLDFNQAEGDRVELDPGTTYTLAQVGSDTVIDMGNGNQMILVGVQLSSLKDGWIFLG